MLELIFVLDDLDFDLTLGSLAQGFHGQVLSHLASLLHHPDGLHCANPTYTPTNGWLGPAHSSVSRIDAFLTLTHTKEARHIRLISH